MFPAESGQDKQSPGSYKPASLAYSVSLRRVRNFEVVLWPSYHTCTHMNKLMFACVPVLTYAHINPTNQTSPTKVSKQ